jgi:twinkle protein
MAELITQQTHLPCEDCGSSDALSVNTDGSTKCFSCGKFTPSEKTEIKIKQVANFLPMQGDYMDLNKRKIPESICRKYGYHVNVEGEPCQIADYRDGQGKLLGQKIRYPNKQFQTRGVCKTLFGQHLWGKGKRITITEGEIDAMSLATVFEGKWAVVSIPSGAQSAASAIKHNLEYLNNFDEIILMFDMDEVGIAATNKCASLLPVGKVFVATLPAKDPNELLVNNHRAELINSYWQARPYRPDGIVDGKEMWDLVSAEEVIDSSPYPFLGLNHITRGLRIGEIVCVCAGTGIGKSNFCREIAYSLMKRNEKVGYIALEESIKRLALGIMSLELGKSLHLGDNTDAEELKTAFNATVGSGNFVTYDHWGSIESDNLINRIRYMVTSLHCRWIFLDHVSIVVSGQDGDERKMIDILMTKLRSLVEEINCGMVLVSHLKRPEGRGYEEGRETTLGALRGSAGLGQLSDMVLSLERNQQDEDEKNISTVRVLKNRFSGETGIACKVEYDVETGRLKEKDEDGEVFNNNDESNGSLGTRNIEHTETREASSGPFSL